MSQIAAGNRHRHLQRISRDSRLDLAALVAFVASALTFGFNWQAGFWAVTLLALYWMAAWLLARSMIRSGLGAILWILSLLLWPGLWPAVLGQSGEAAAAIASFLTVALIYRARRKRAPGYAWLSLVTLIFAVQWNPDAYWGVIPLALLWGQIAARLFPSDRLSRATQGLVIGLAVAALLFGAAFRGGVIEIPPAPPMGHQDWFFFEGWFYFTVLAAAGVAHWIRRVEDRWSGFVLAVLASGFVDAWVRVGGGSLYTPKVFLWSALAAWIGAALLLRKPER